MSTGAVDRVNDAAATAQQQKTKKQGQSSSKSDLFATLVKGQVPSNIVFTRVDKHLDVPQTAKTNDDSVPVTPARDERAASETDPVETYETSAAHDAAAPKRDDAATKKADGGGDVSRPEASSDSTAAAPDAAETASKEPAAAPDASKAAAAQNGQVTSDATDTVAKAVVADPSAAKQQAANTNAANKPQDAATDVKGQSALAGQDTDLAQKAANAAKGKVGKTEQAVAKPNTGLASETTVTAQSAAATQSARPAQAGADRPTATQLANAASDSESPAPSANGLARANANGAATKGAEKSGANNQAGANQNANSAASQNPAAAAFDQLVANAAAQTSTGSQATNATVQNVGATSSDPVTGAGTIQNAQTNSAARAAAQTAAAAKPKVPPQVVTEQVAVNINRAAGQGLDRISIQMRPSELGKVDVKMEVAHDGRVTAVITVERQETFDMLRGDSRALTQALQDAGLQADQNSLSFNLQGQGSGNTQDGPNSSGSGLAGDSLAEGEEVGDGILAMGETAQADAEGHYDVRV